MSISDLPVLSALRTKMQWHQVRQRVLSENVSNTNTPNFKPRDLIAPDFGRDGSRTGQTGPLAMMGTTSGSTIQPADSVSRQFDVNSRSGFQTRPSGSAVSLEDEMMKVSANQMDYAAATSLYSKSLHLLKTAIGKG
jgi:flagellar basal-body rod protein FlgB